MLKRRLFIPFKTPPLPRTSPTNSMDPFHDPFNHLLTPEQRAESDSSYEDFRGIRSHNLRKIPPDPYSQLHTKTDELDRSEDPLISFQKYASQSKPRFPPPEVLPCANVKVAKYRVCPNPGDKACSSCRLVSYCSKVIIDLSYRQLDYSHFS